MGSIKQQYTSSVDEKNDSRLYIPHDISNTNLIQKYENLDFFLLR